MFYELEKDLIYPSVWYNDNFEHFYSIKCPVHDGHQRGTRITEQSLCVVVKSSKIGDFVSTVYSDWLITDRVAELLSGYKLTGYNLRRVSVSNRQLPFHLWELRVTGKGGEAHPDSGIKKIYTCEHCGLVHYKALTDGIGIIVDEKNWDGSDFFTINAYSKFVLVNEKVKSILVDNQLTGVLCVPSNELTRNGAYLDYVSPTPQTGR